MDTTMKKKLSLVLALALCLSLAACGGGKTAQTAAPAAEAKAAAEAMRRDYLAAQVGRTLPVLFETEAEGLWQGHSDNYLLVCAPEGGHGIMKNVKITSVSGEKLMGIGV